MTIGTGIFALLYGLGEERYPKYFQQRQIIRQAVAEKDIRALVLGSSHANVIRAERLGFAKDEILTVIQGGADLYETTFQLRTLVPRLPALETVIMSISYFSFSYDNAAFITEDGVNNRLEKRRYLYAILPAWDCIRGDVKSLFLGKLYPIFTNDHWESVLGESVLGESNLRRRALAGESRAAEKPHKLSIRKKIKKLNRQGRNRVRSVCRRIDTMKENNPHVETESFQRLFQQVKQLESDGIRVIFVTPPYWQTYVTSFPAYYKKMVRENMARITRLGAEYYDFSQSRFFIRRPHWYANADHLQSDGFGVFNSFLKKSLQERRLAWEFL